VSAAGLVRAPRRLSRSEIGTLHRCPWRWHLRHVRRLERSCESDAKPQTVWGTCYHAAIAALLVTWARGPHYTILDTSGFDSGGCGGPHDLGSMERSLAAWADLDPWETEERGLHVAEVTPDVAAVVALLDKGIDPDDELAHKGVVRRAGDIAAEAAQAAVEVADWLEAEGWRVAWVTIGGREVPAVELQIGAKFDGVGVDGRFDCILISPAGDLVLVDHKTLAQWPETAGDALARDEVGGVDLRDDLQARMYVLALEAMGIRVARVLHLIRRATIAKPPPIVYKPTDKRHGPSRAKDVETTPDLYRAAVIECGKDPADYAEEIARAGSTRWHAWATVSIHPTAQRRTLPILQDAARLADAYAAMAPDDVPRHHVPGGRNRTDSCARCPDRDLCIAEDRGLESDALDEIMGRYTNAAPRYAPADSDIEPDTAEEDSE
jgi:hypothetical protein